MKKRRNAIRTKTSRSKASRSKGSKTKRPQTNKPQTKKPQTKVHQRKTAEEVMELDRNLLRELQDDPLGSTEAATDEAMEIYGQDRKP
jgi:hypothetical protein